MDVRMSLQDSNWATRRAELARLLEQRTTLVDFEPQPNSHLVEDLNLDSIDMVELRVAIEEHYQIEISDTNWSGIRTLSDLSDLIDRTANN